MKAGDTVKLVGIHPNLPDAEGLATRKLFEECLGQSFVVIALEQVESLPYPLVKLDVGHVLGEESWKHTMWAEPKYMQVENPAVIEGEGCPQL